MDLEGSIHEHQQVMKWYGERNIPVERNELHHRGMRDAPDVVCIVAAFLSAYNAKTYGVEDYIAWNERHDGCRKNVSHFGEDPAAGR